MVSSASSSIIKRSIYTNYSSTPSHDYACYQSVAVLNLEYLILMLTSDCRFIDRCTPTSPHVWGGFPPDSPHWYHGQRDCETQEWMSHWEVIERNLEEMQAISTTEIISPYLIFPKAFLINRGCLGSHCFSFFLHLLLFFFFILCNNGIQVISNHFQVSSITVAIDLPHRPPSAAIHSSSNVTSEEPLSSNRFFFQHDVIGAFNWMADILRPLVSFLRTRKLCSWQCSSCPLLTWTSRIQSVCRLRIYCPRDGGLVWGTHSIIVPIPQAVALQSSKKENNWGYGFLFFRPIWNDQEDCILSRVPSTVDGTLTWALLFPLWRDCGVLLEGGERVADCAGWAASAGWATEPGDSSLSLWKIAELIESAECFAWPYYTEVFRRSCTFRDKQTFSLMAQWILHALRLFLINSSKVLDKVYACTCCTSLGRNKCLPVENGLCRRSPLREIGCEGMFFWSYLQGMTLSFASRLSHHARQPATRYLLHTLIRFQVGFDRSFAPTDKILSSTTVGRPIVAVRRLSFATSSRSSSCCTALACYFLQEHFTSLPTNAPFQSSIQSPIHCHSL
ncbi:hypothetical protein VP01_307g2 [Puccinia sorghi]|uniref:Uncharacterized protein n=1 Tax=Puccinia sorghi TaxID=27349 RepID=A0A0L6UZP2_9BASI|nr:hypothetical protein VP01_307g2 [Puccinia sorghi]